MSQGYSLYVIMKRYSFYTQIKKKLKQPLQRMKKKITQLFFFKDEKKNQTPFSPKTCQNKHTQRKPTDIICQPTICIIKFDKSMLSQRY